MGLTFHLSLVSESNATLVLHSDATPTLDLTVPSRGRGGVPSPGSRRNSEQAAATNTGVALFAE